MRELCCLRSGPCSPSATVLLASTTTSAPSLEPARAGASRLARRTSHGDAECALVFTVAPVFRSHCG
jgi:hypothetical protein